MKFFCIVKDDLIVKIIITVEQTLLLIFVS